MVEICFTLYQMPDAPPMANYSKTICLRHLHYVTELFLSSSNPMCTYSKYCTTVPLELHHNTTCPIQDDLDSAHMCTWYLLQRLSVTALSLSLSYHAPCNIPYPSFICPIKRICLKLGLAFLAIHPPDLVYWGFESSRYVLNMKANVSLCINKIRKDLLTCMNPGNKYSACINTRANR